MVDYSAYIGLNVHKDKIAVAVVLPGREDPVYRGEIRNERSSLRRLVRHLSPCGEVLSLGHRPEDQDRGRLLLVGQRVLLGRQLRLHWQGKRHGPVLGMV